MDKEKRIQNEIERLNEILSVQADENAINGVKGLVENVAFLAVTLQDLQATINKCGITNEWKNGENQFGIRKSPEVDTYLSMMKLYVSATKQLMDLLPRKAKEEPSRLIEFLNKYNR